MTRELLPAVELVEGGRYRVRSPGVGWWSDHPPAHAVLRSGQRIGTLERLNHRLALVLPEGVAGRIATPPPGDRRVPVEHGAVLLELEPLDQASAGDPEHGGSVGAGDQDLAPGRFAVVSPTDGVFYRGPSPEAAPFVETGSHVRGGQPVGLVEVMKTFNQIVYGGPGLPPEAEVVEIRCKDAQEVRAGEVLIVVQ